MIQVIFRRHSDKLGCSCGFSFYVLISEIDVVCQPDFIEVSLKISDFPGIVLNDSSLHLEDRNCVPGYKDNTKVTFKFGLEDCSTKHKNDGEKIYYTNKVYLKAGEAAEDEAITREHTEIIPFHCGYNKKAILSKVSYNPRAVQIITDTGKVLAWFPFIIKNILSISSLSLDCCVCNL